ncbi:MAG TPA: hypothetical protein VF605_08175 [Allosphingosinicella sp.]|jgi:hypothetical protein
MTDRRTFRIVTADKLSLDQFARWHALLVSLAQPGMGAEHLLPVFGFKFVLRPTDLPVPDCDLSWGIDAKGRTVQINPAASAGDANVLSAIGEDRERPGQYAVLRQGRLQRNRETTSQISGGEFRYAFQKLPVSATGSFGARGREWYLVCDLSDDPEEVARQSADFVERCSRVRAKYAAPGE